MIEIIRTKDGTKEVIGRDLDFQDLIRKYIGDEAANYYESRIRDMEDVIDDIQLEVSIVQTLLEENGEEYSLEEIQYLLEDAERVRWDR